jgi:glycosyltransferase involved in cell wall biosynthesis
MKHELPRKVLITGGREIGGVSSFAEGLRAGFAEFGIPVEIVPPSQIFARWLELRDPRVLKILSTSAVFAAPLARRALCVAHGVPRAGEQGWVRVLSIIASFKLANRCSGVQLVAVSHYTATTLGAVFSVRTDTVIHNPAKAVFLEAPGNDLGERNYVTYVGRLIRAKNLHRILPAVQDLLDETPGIRMCIMGAGQESASLRAMTAGDARFEFRESASDLEVREQLRRTRIFVSGNEVEGFGIAYLEAIAQGCIVAMPACGGGLEIAPECIGSSVQLMPLSWERAEMVTILRRALAARWAPVATDAFSARAAAQAYLKVDARFTNEGKFAQQPGEQSAAQALAENRGARDCGRAI